MLSNASTNSEGSAFCFIWKDTNPAGRVQARHFPEAIEYTEPSVKLAPTS